MTTPADFVPHLRNYQTALVEILERSGCVNVIEGPPSPLTTAEQLVEYLQPSETGAEVWYVDRESIKTGVQTANLRTLSSRSGRRTLRPIIHNMELVGMIETSEGALPDRRGLLDMRDVFNASYRRTVERAEALISELERNPNVLPYGTLSDGESDTIDQWNYSLSWHRFGDRKLWSVQVRLEALELRRI